MSGAKNTLVVYISVAEVALWTLGLCICMCLVNCWLYSASYTYWIGLFGWSRIVVTKWSVRVYWAVQ